MATFCNMAYTWDANKNKTSESITGVMSGYGVTTAGTTAGNEDLCFSSSLPPPDSSLLIDIDTNGTADVTFQYDALGRRVARSGTGGSVVFVQMDQQTIADYPVGGAATTPTFRYVYASYIDEPVVRKTAGTGGTLVYFHRNHQYSVTAVTTSTGSIAERYAYTAYGQPTILDASGVALPTSNFSIRTSYTGREWDATLALHHFRARWVSGLTGRFLSRDPITYRGGINLYEYVSSNPLWYVDPYGHLEKPPIPAPSPGVVGGVCRVVTRRVMLPVTVLVLGYKCGTKVAEYTTIPIAVIVTEWVCSDPNPNPGPNPSPDPPSQPPVNPPQPPRDPNARCWCCDLQTYPSDGSPGGTKNCRPERAAECWAGYPFSMCCHPSTPATPAINPCAEDPRFPFEDKDKWVEDFNR